MGKISNYFKSEWSYAQYRIGDVRSICAFSEDGTSIIAITSDGNYCCADIPKSGGECKNGQRKPLT